MQGQSRGDQLGFTSDTECVPLQNRRAVKEVWLLRRVYNWFKRTKFEESFLSIQKFYLSKSSPQLLQFAPSVRNW